LAKCFKAQLWENSKFVSRQLNKIGIILSTALVNGGLTNLESIENADSRIIEMLAKRNPPFGKQIKDAVKCLPKYSIKLNESHKSEGQKQDSVLIEITLINYETIRENNSAQHSSILLIGDSNDRLIYSQRLSQHVFKNNPKWSKELSSSQLSEAEKLTIHLINEQFVGLDVSLEYIPKSAAECQNVKRIPTSSVVFLFKSKCPSKRIKLN